MSITKIHYNHIHNYDVINDLYIRKGVHYHLYFLGDNKIFKHSMLPNDYVKLFG